MNFLSEAYNFEIRLKAAIKENRTRNAMIRRLILTRHEQSTPISNFLTTFYYSIWKVDLLDSTIQARGGRNSRTQLYKVLQRKNRRSDKAVTNTGFDRM